MPDIKKIVKDKYASIATTPTAGCGCSCKEKKVAAEIGYTLDQLHEVGEANMGLGCGNPVAFSAIKQGDTIVDLGSGGGIDCFLASKKTGPKGKVIGIDFTKEMIERAQANAKKGNYTNVEFLKADIEELPLQDNSVDIIISNCVINLAPDKDNVFREAYRVLKPKGSMYVSDIVLLADLTPEQRADKELISGCVAGALLKHQYLEAISKAGFTIQVLNENKDISKQQYQGIPLQSVMVRAEKR